jgi:hypothetical protein
VECGNERFHVIILLEKCTYTNTALRTTYKDDCMSYSYTMVAGMMGAGWLDRLDVLVLHASSQESERAVNKSGNTLISAIVAATNVKRCSILL